MGTRPRPKVLVTRAASQSSALAVELERQGLEPVAIPAIEIEPPADHHSFEQAIGKLEAFDWLVLTSANAVDALRERLARGVFPLPSPGRPNIAVIGAATARAAESAGFTVDLVPETAVAESLAESLLPFARVQGRAGRFLLLRAEQAREHLPETLAGAGAEVHAVVAYRNVVPAGSIEPIRALFHGSGSVAAVAFTSSSSVRQLLALCEAAGVSLPEFALRISIGPITSATLRECALPPHAEAASASVASLAEAVREALGLV